MPAVEMQASPLCPSNRHDISNEQSTIYMHMHGGTLTQAQNSVPLERYCELGTPVVWPFLIDGGRVTDRWKETIMNADNSTLKTVPPAAILYHLVSERIRIH